MNKYKKLVSNTLIFAIGSFGSKILLLLLTRLYTGNINPGDNSTTELLEQTENFLIPIITFSIADAVIRYGIDKNFDNRKVFTSACVTELFGIGILLLLSPALTLLPYTEGYVVLLVIYCITSGFRQIASQFVRARGLVRLFAIDGILATLTLFYHRVFDTYQSFMFIASAGLIVFVRILSNILIDSNTYPEYATAFLYTPVLIVGVLMMCFNQFLSSVYSATQHTTHSFWTSLVAAIVNIVLNIILIHIWGIMGAAIATFASYFVCYCIRIVDARKYVPFPVNHAKFAANTAALFLLGIVVVEAPPMWILILAVGFVFMVLYNFNAVTQTLGQLRRRK